MPDDMKANVDMGYEQERRPRRRPNGQAQDQRAQSAQARRTAGDGRYASAQRPQGGDASRYRDASRYTGRQRSSDSAATQRDGRSPYADQGQYANQGRADGYAQYEGARRANAQGYANQASPSTARYNDPSRYTAAAGGYNSLYDARRGGAAPAKKSKAPTVILIVIALAIVAALLWFFVIPKPFEVTVNGKEVTMNPGATVATLVEEGHARPAPGNLLAVDGSLISTGEGEKFSATINGDKAAPDAKLAKDMVVEISNGGDLTEDFTSTEEAVPFETVNDDMSFEAYWSGSIHEMQDGKDGLATTKTGTISGKTVQEITVKPVAGGYHNYTVQTDQPVIALTFDDGPWPETTHQILDILEANGAKATFFTIGNQIGSHADAVTRAVNMGCEMCTHSWDHADGSGQGVDLTLMSPSEQIDEITQGYQAIAAVTGKEPPHIIRAPGGNFHDDIINTLWSYVDAEIGWDVDTEDWARPGVDAIVARILSVEPGQVILMHDGGGERDQTVEALRQALPVLIERGYKCVTVSELMTYNNAGQQAAAAEEPTAIEVVEMEG